MTLCDYCFRRWGVVFCGCLLFAGLAVADDGQTLARQMPGGAVAFAELAGLETVIDRVQESERLASFLESEQYREAAKLPQVRQALAGRQVLESQVQMDLWTLARTLLGGRVAVGLYPHEGRQQPDVLVLLESPQPEKLRQLREKIEPFLQLGGSKVQRSTIDGVEVLDLEGKAYAATADGWLAVSNGRHLLEQSLKMRSGEQNGLSAVADQEYFQKVDAQLGSQHLLRAAVDSAAIAKAVGRRVIPEKLDNPLGSLLFGGIAELLATTPAAGLALDVADQSAVLTLSLVQPPDQLPDRYRVFFAQAGGGQPSPLPPLPDLIAGFTLYRQFADWYNARDQLIADNVLPEFDKFEAGLGNLLPNRDFGSDVLPLFGSTLSFIAAPQSFEHLESKPGVVLPGFALLLDLKQPDEAEAVVQLFFQTLTAVLNLQAGQQGRQPWVIASEVHNGETMLFARYLEKPKGDRLSVVFNFQPAAARVGSRYVLSSSVDLTRRIIDAFKQPDRAAGTSRDLHVELHGGPIADALAANREHLVAQGVREGKSPERAASDLDLFLTFVRSIDAVRLSTQSEKQGYSLRVEGAWK